MEHVVARIGQKQFRNRREAGVLLADNLLEYRDTNCVVVAMARGGVPVGFEVSRKLGVGLEVLVTRKLGATLNKELGVGAIAEGGVVRFNTEIIGQLGIELHDLRIVLEEEGEELGRMVRAYKDGVNRIGFEGRRVLLVDDGLATGISAACGIAALQMHNPREIVLACPVSTIEGYKRIEREIDTFVSLVVTDEIESIGWAYGQFGQVSDWEVVELLEQARFLSGN